MKAKNRRQFLKDTAIAVSGFMLGVPIVFANKIPVGYTLVGDVQDLGEPLPEKHPQMTILNDRPVNAETPPHLLDADLTPNDLFFVRNNGLPPSKATIKKSQWILTIGGESTQKEKTFTLDDLKNQFKTYTYHLTLECGGNGRSEFNPPAKGNQWSLGAVGCAAWTGVRLRDVLQSVGIKKDARYIGYYGKDTHLSGRLDKQSISRGVPIAKALQEESLIAWSMNGKDLPWLNGYPLRLVFGGWPASCSGKWLTRIDIRNKVHDGAKMNGQAYRIPCTPVAPGTKVPDEEMCIIESMPVKSLITFPKTGGIVKYGRTIPIRGHAWAGELSVDAVEYSIDFGATWQQAKVASPINRFAWQRWNAKVSFPKVGYYEIWARAKDSRGNYQPMVLPGWNPKGYLNNACHRIAIKVEQ